MHTNETLISVFEDTVDFYTNNEVLKRNVSEIKRKTKFYKKDEYVTLPETDKSEGVVTVTRSRTFEAAMRLHKDNPGKRICVLNFASARHPGGGVETGAGAQEECLCRCSTLYPALTQQHMIEKYYMPHRENRSLLYSDALIYTPEVLICKTDELVPKRMEEKDFVTVDIITCAAPNLRNPVIDGKKITDKDLFDIHVKRGKHILNIAAANDARILVLGAYGCGAFKNPPEVVAKAYNEVLEEYRDKFDLIEFAVYCGAKNTHNFDCFERIINKTK